MEERLEVMVGGKMLRFETGKIGRSADGSVTVTQGETVVYASACAESKPQVRLVGVCVPVWVRAWHASEVAGKRDPLNRAWEALP